jgi:hypothetical protein
MDVAVEASSVVPSVVDMDPSDADLEGVGVVLEASES